MTSYSVNIFGVANEILREREPTVKARRTIEFASELDALDRSQTRLVPFIVRHSLLTAPWCKPS